MCRLRHIVRAAQIIKRWSQKSRKNNKINQVPSDVPPGHVAVIVSDSSQRFIVRLSHLNHPLFKNLLKKAEDEFGFDNHNNGPICLPCDDATFIDILRVVTRNELKSTCGDSVPLLYGRVDSVVS